MSWVPDCLVGRVIMAEGMRGHLRSLRVPHLDGFVHGGADDHALVDVVHFAALHLGRVAFKYCHRPGLAAEIPDLERAVSARRDYLILIGLGKADVEARVLSWDRLHDLQGALTHS